MKYRQEAGAMMTTYTDQTLRQTDLEPTPRTALSSMTRMRDYFVRLAMNQWGGPEGRNWAIAQNPRGTLIPIYARNRTTGDTIEIR